MAPPSSSSLPTILLFFFFFVASLAHRCGSQSTFSFDIHHRFSDKVRNFAASVSADAAAWPEEGSIEYYSALVEHDRALLRGRGLSGGDQELAFVDGNDTIRLSAMGFLYYAEVAIGTPIVRFLVALDTGSDLFWLPCDCQSCAPRTFQEYNVTFDNYSPSSSSTSRKVPCNSSLCETQSSCNRATDLCAYKVQYVSANTSTSGILVEDILHLKTESASKKPVDAKVTFGCGQVQTGSFLRSAAPNGLLGLGRDKISVPSMLATLGLTSDSFSMCFGRDGIGRIDFGDRGSSDQQETPFSSGDQSHPSYIVTVTGIQVENISSTGNFSAFVDSGTSFTIIADPAYTILTDSFDSLVKDQRIPSVRPVPFQYCYALSSAQTLANIPGVDLLMKGGSKFPVVSPIVVISTPVQDMYCLAILKSHSLNIIGQNFLTGLRVVFDREKLTMGWKKFNCYDAKDSNTVYIDPRNSNAHPPASVAMGPTSYTPKDTSNTRSGSSLQSSSVQSFQWNVVFFNISFLLLFLIL